MVDDEFGLSAVLWTLELLASGRLLAFSGTVRVAVVSFPDEVDSLFSAAHSFP